MSDANQNVKQIIVNALRSIELEDGFEQKMSLMERAALRGKHPIEFLSGIVAQLPDSVIPHLVTVSRAIVDAVDSHDAG